MKFYLTSLVLCTIVLLSILGCGTNGEAHSQHAKNSNVQSGDWGNTTCPIMGDPIDKNVFTTYEGKKVYFCCEDCIPKFKKNPGKYLTALKQGKATNHDDHSGHQH